MVVVFDLRVSSRPMCEHFIARAAEPFRLDELWPFAERLERFGIAGFGWGAAWLGAGRAASRVVPRRPGVPRRPRARRGRCDRDDGGPRPPAPSVAAVDADDAPTPSRSTTRPAASRSATTATCATTGACATAYRAQGRIHGRADTEVGARWLEDAWHTGEPVAHLLGALHDRFGGQANLAVLTADGAPHHYAGNGENPVFTFRLGRIGIVSTGIYSLDRSLFRFVAPGATDRRLVPLHTTATLDRDGRPDRVA